MRWLNGFPWVVAFVAAMVVGCSCSESGAGAGLDGGGLPDGAIVLDDGRIVGGCGQEACTLGDTQYCGPIEDPCSSDIVECGQCPSGLTCGVLEPSVCGDPTGGGGGECISGLCEHQVDCSGPGPQGTPTTLTGTVYAPDGITPLNNAVVYVPNNADPASLPPITEGASCERCEDEDLGSPITGAISGPDGSFTLRNVPADVDFPLVVKAGKWRRVVMIDAVEPCTSRALTVAQSRLPRNKSEGHIPKIAVVAGAVDALECVLHRMGVDAEEFTRASGDGRIHLWRSNGAWADEELEDMCHNGCHNNRHDNWRCTDGPDECGEQLARNLYRDQDKLDGYDMIFFGCDYNLNGSTRDDTWTEDDHARIQAYGDKGGRLFLSHYNYEWLSRSRAPQEFQDLADYSGGHSNGIPDCECTPAWIDTDFQRGLTFLQWLENVGAAHDNFDEGHIFIEEARTHVRYVNEPAQRWTYITDEDHGRDAVQSFTFDMPLSASEDQTCGRTVYSAFHVIDGNDLNQEYFPNHCATGDLSPQELALIFMMFDLAACVSDRPPEWECTPTTCGDVDAECGRVIDGCGGLQECGDCPPNHLCNPATNQCTFVG
jgi:hypothetical protein